MDQVDLDIAQARANLFPNKYDRHRISQALTIRRLSSRHYKRPMSEGSVCSGWMLLLFLVWSLHHIHSKYWRSFKRRHQLLVYFISLPMTLCLRPGRKLWKEFEQSDAAYDAVVMLGLYWEVICELWLFLKRYCLTTEIHIMYIDPDNVRSRRMLTSKVTKKPIVYMMYEMVLCYGTGWAWFRSLLIGPSKLVIRQLLILSGDVELNPGPLDHEIEKIISKVDDTLFEEDSWNIVIDECSSLAAKWEQVSGLLGLQISDIDTIKLNHPGDNKGCWNEALKHWIKQNYNTRKFGEPSWRSLLTAVAKVDKLKSKELAAKHQAGFARTLRRINSSRSSLGQRFMNLFPKATRRYSKEFEGPEGGTPDKTEVGNAPSPAISCSVNLNPEEKQLCYEMVSSQSQEMAYKFQKLFTATRRSLREEKVPVSELVGHLQCLGLIKPTFKDASQSPMPLRRQLPKLAAAETVEDVMFVVKDYCSFFNYHMLEHIIDEFGTQQDKDNLGVYKKDFDNYAHCCVIEGSLEVGKMIEEGFSNMIVILDDSFDDCTLSHLNVFIADLRKALKLPSGVMLRLCYINRGSIKLTFQLSDDHIILQHIFPLSPEQETLLVKLGIVELSSGAYKFTRQQDKTTQLEAEDPCAADGDPNYAHSTGDTEWVSVATGHTGTLKKPGNTHSAVEGSSCSGTTAVGTVTTEVSQLKAENPCASERDSDFADSDTESESTAAGQALRKPRDTWSFTDSALGKSSYTGRTASIEDLLDKPDIDYPNMRFRIKYDCAIDNLNDTFAETECDSTKFELHLSAHDGDLEAVKHLIKVKKLDPSKEDEEGRNVLHYAAVGGQLSVMKYFIEEEGQNPADQCCTGRCAGWTPLHFAAQFNRLEVVQYLVAELEVDPLCLTNSGDTPLHKACCSGNIDIVTYLVDAMRKYLPLEEVVSCQGKDGQTPLHSAASYGRLEIVKYIITELKCDPNIVTTDKQYGIFPKFRGRIALHLAAQTGNLSVLKYLIEDQHCNPSHLDHENVTPLHLAAERGRLDVVKYLTLEQHCDPRCSNKNADTPLHMAASHGHLNVVKFFINNLHCPVNIKGWCAKTPLEMAQDRKHHQVVKYLESCINPPLYRRVFTYIKSKTKTSE